MADLVSNKKKVYLVDGSGYIFRAYFAIRGLKTSAGLPTNAVFGFTNMLVKLLKDHDPKYICVLFDRKEPTFRHEIYADYKANRPEPPADLIPQFDLIHKVVEVFNIKNISLSGYEADDLIGTLTKQAKSQGYEVVIVTGDKDLMQLVEPGVVLLDELRAHKLGHEEFIDQKSVFEHMGVKPKQVIDFLALAGDSSDNIPGVKGIGKKTAAELINNFESLEKLYEQLGLIKQDGRRQKLMDGRKLAFLSKKLVTIDNNISPDLFKLLIKDLKYSGINKEKARELFTKLEFKKIIQDKYLFGENISLPDLNTPSITKNNYQNITTKLEFVNLIKKLENISKIAIDTETDSLDSMTANLVGISLAWEKNKAVYIPVGHDTKIIPNQLSLDFVREELNKLFANSQIIWVAQNAKFDWKILSRHGFTNFKISGDPMLANYLLCQDNESHSLDNLSKKYLDYIPISFAQVCGSGKSQIKFSQVNLELATNYAAEDADLALRLEKLLKNKLESQNLLNLYEKIELPMEEVLSKMELRGVLLDKSVLKNLDNKLTKRIENLRKQAWDLAGEEFNLDSPKQVSEILFNKLNLSKIKKTKTGYSTDSYVLEKLISEHEICKVLLGYRVLSKLLNTYVLSLPKLVNLETNRVHTSYNQFVTATGRLSSSDPNLQNIPARTPEGRIIRQAFVSKMGYKLISLDYSQVELRILAYASKDSVLCDAFEKNQDVHQRTASEIFEIAPEKITKSQRNIAKIINFGLLYGMGAHRLSQTLNISRKQASEYLEKYFAKYSGILTWKEECLEQARKAGEVRTYFGRKRLLPEISSQNALIRNRGERIAINTPIQGSAADIIKIAMIASDKYLSKNFPESKLILQVHDELVIEAREADAEIIAQEISQIMSTCHGLKLDLKVDFGIAQNWDDAH